ncbi:MAG: hypothetical protein WAQ05_21070, partial [Rubrivivax sp.]
MQRRVLLSAAALLPLLARAQAAAAFSAEDLAHAGALRELALRDNEAWQLVESLTTDIGARPAGSAADARAAAWG